MSKGLDWQSARQRENARTEPYYPAPSATKSARFQRNYARYAKQQKAAGRKPLPPVQWIESLRSQRP
jgi:hypothetical protein